MLLLWSVKDVAWRSPALLTLLATNTSIRLWPVLWGWEFCGFLSICFSNCGVEIQESFEKGVRWGHSCSGGTLDEV